MWSYRTLWWLHPTTVMWLDPYVLSNRVWLKHAWQQVRKPSMFHLPVNTGWSIATATEPVSNWNWTKSSIVCVCGVIPGLGLESCACAVWIFPLKQTFILQNKSHLDSKSRRATAHLARLRLTLLCRCYNLLMTALHLQCLTQSGVRSEPVWWDKVSSLTALH